MQTIVLFQSCYSVTFSVSATFFLVITNVISFVGSIARGACAPFDWGFGKATPKIQTEMCRKFLPSTPQILIKLKIYLQENKQIVVTTLVLFHFSKLSGHASPYVPIFAG